MQLRFLKSLPYILLHSLSHTSSAAFTLSASTMMASALICSFSSIAQADELTLTEGQEYTIFADTEEDYTQLTLAKSNTLINYGTLTVDGTISISSAGSTETSNLIQNYGSFTITNSSTATINAYNTISNYDGGTITIDGSAYFVLKTNAKMTNEGDGTIYINKLKINTSGTLENNGSGNIYITEVACYAAAGVIRSGEDATGKIIIETLAYDYNSHALENLGAGEIIVNSANFNNATSATNSGDGVIAFGELTHTSSGALTNSDAGDMYIAAGSISGSVVNSGTGTLHLGTSYTYTDPESGTDKTLSSTSNSITVESGGSISNGAEATMSVTGNIILNTGSTFTNDGTLKIEGGSIDATGLELTLGGTVTLTDGASITADSLTLTLVAPSSDASSVATYDATTGTNGTITATDLTLTTGADYTSASTDSLTITITALDGLTLNVDGELTLNIDLSDSLKTLYTSYLADGKDISIVFGSSLNTSDLANATITVGDSTLDTNKFTTDENGNLVFDSNANIPEPGTATLSLLALAGLLARRRRHAA